MQAKGLAPKIDGFQTWFQKMFFSNIFSTELFFHISKPLEKENH